MASIKYCSTIYTSEDMAEIKDFILQRERQTSGQMSCKDPLFGFITCINFFLQFFVQRGT